MNAFIRALFRAARWIAGRDRAEWLDAMAAEAESIKGDSTAWAIGCLWASLKDRIKREWKFALAVVLLPLGVIAVTFALFFPVVELSELLGLPVWSFIVVNLLAPCPFAFVLGRMRPGLGSYAALPISFAICELTPLFVMWIEFGTSPLAFFGPKGHWYNMSPAAGLSCAFAVWLAGAWLGSRTRPTTHKG
jgi:hypothetical protein